MMFKAIMEKNQGTDQPLSDYFDEYKKGLAMNLQLEIWPLCHRG